MTRLALVGVVPLLLSGLPAAAVSAELIAVQCTIDSYRSSYAPRPESIIVQVEVEAGRMVTFYGTLPLKITRRELRGVGTVDGGWQASILINRRSGRLEAGTSRFDAGKYSYVELRGRCILPPELREAGYTPD